MTDGTITLEDDGARGRYVYRHGDAPPAELTFSRDGDVLVIDHTGVPAAYRGQGIALQLVERLIADARDNGWTLRPVCSYVVAQFAKHPEWADLREG